jgi:hypothetical protein
MNKKFCSGVICWGAFAVITGLVAMNTPMLHPVGLAARFLTFAAPDQEDVFLLAGGIVTLLVGLVSLIGVVGRFPGFTPPARPMTGIV